MNYVLETRAETLKKQTNLGSKILGANEMKVLRQIVGKTKIDRIRNRQIRESCCIQSINRWEERRRRREWDEHVTRMDAEILVKISRDNTSARRRSPERPKEDLKREEPPITRRRRFVFMNFISN